MAISRRPKVDPVYEAIAEWVDRCLRHDGSLFTPDHGVWTVVALDDLHARFNSQPDTTGATFEQKFKKQLESAPADTVQVAAEVYYVHLIVADDMKGSTKRALVEKVLSWSPTPVAIPEHLAGTLDTGLCNSGVAFKTYRPTQLWFLIDFARSWKNLAVDEQSRLLDDPWAFKDWLFSLSIFAAYAQREAILHFVHPETFENIISRQHKSQIAKAFADRADGEPDDVDRKLLAIRKSWEAERGKPFDFYLQGIDTLWKPEGSPNEKAQKQTPQGDGTAPTLTRRGWLVRLHGPATAWLEDGFCGIDTRMALGELPEKVSRQGLIQQLRNLDPDGSATTARMDAAVLDRFINQMQLDDVVVTKDGKDVHVGVVASEAYWEAGDADYPRRRIVDWATSPGAAVDIDSLPPRAISKLNTLHRVADVTEDLAAFEQAMLGGHGPDLFVPPITAALAAQLLIGQTWLDDLRDSLLEKRQLVFYGPPGTGKTFLAQKLAAHLVAEGGAFSLVQFHPSYAYEDFFEGFRPQQGAVAGTISFELTPGPLRRIAEAARVEPSRPHVLIIDEINRANLAKVFGELYFLLEYRDSQVTLQYSAGEDFTLPTNLFVIGTMNTADRSIALVDAAMRRRFYFVGFFPDQEPISGLLRRWLLQRQLPTDAADLLDELNRRLDDRDTAIGPSYLMTPDIAKPGRVERIWDRAVLPLLEEQFVGTSTDVRAFGLDVLRKHVANEHVESDPAP